MRKVSIKGTGSCIPEKVVTNAYFEEIVATSDEWITTRTGIKERRMIEPGQALTDLAYPASQRALEAAGIDPMDLDMIIVGTASPDMVTPSASCILQHRLGAYNANAFDVNAACPGFIYGMSIAEKYIQDGSNELVLVVGAEIVSNRIDYSDRATCVLFGDGAGAVVLGPKRGDDDGEFLATQMKADGRLWGLLNLPGGGSRNPPSVKMLEGGLHFLKMQGNEVFKHAVRNMVDACEKVMEEAGYTSGDVKWLIPHQANLRIMEVVAKRLEIPIEKVIVTVHKYGNTSAATIPTAFDEFVRSGKIRRGDLILITSFGAGFTWGATLFRY